MACSISVLLFFSKSKCLFWRQKSISVGSDMDENPAKNNAKQLILYVLSMSSGHLIAVIFLDFLPSQPECQVGPRNEPASNMSNLSQLSLNILHYLAKCWCLSTAHQIPVPPNKQPKFNKLITVEHRDIFQGICGMCGMLWYLWYLYLSHLHHLGSWQVQEPVARRSRNRTNCLRNGRAPRNAFFSRSEGIMPMTRMAARTRGDLAESWHHTSDAAIEHFFEDLEV